MRSGIGPQGHFRVRAVNLQPQRIRFDSAAYLRLAHTKPTDHNSFPVQLTHLPEPCSQQRAGRRHCSSRPLLVDLPVGENLQDHVMVPITIKSKSFPPLQSDSARISCALVQSVLCV
jgi:hypothetical protein